MEDGRVSGPGRRPDADFADPQCHTLQILTSVDGGSRHWYTQLEAEAASPADSCLSLPTAAIQGRKQDLVNRLKAAVGTATAPAVAAGGLEATQAQPGVLEATQAQAAPHTNGLADEPSADEIAADAAAAQAAEETLATAIEEDAAEAAEEAEAEAQEEAEAELDAQEEEELGEPEHISLEDDQTFADEPENHRCAAGLGRVHPAVFPSRIRPLLRPSLYSSWLVLAAAFI